MAVLASEVGGMEAPLGPGQEVGAGDGDRGLRARVDDRYGVRRGESGASGVLAPETAVRYAVLAAVSLRLIAA